MASTGEVANISDRPLEAFFSSWLSTEQTIRGKRLLVSVCADYKIKLFPALKALEEKGWDLFATEGTHDFLAKRGVGSVSVYKVGEKYEPNVATLIGQQKVDLIISIPRALSETTTDGYLIRRLAIDHHIPLISNLQLATLFLQCLTELDIENLPLRALYEK